jgi:hypothetical protein
MVRNLAAGLALAGFLLAGEPFAELVKEFVPGVSSHQEPTGRVALVTRLTAFDNPEGAKLLVAGLAALVDRLEKDLANYESLRKQYEKVNVPIDVAKDNYRTRTNLQNQLAEEDQKQRDDGKVLDALGKAMGKYQDTQALSTLTAEIRKLSAWRAREVAAEGLAANAGGSEAAIKMGREKDERVTAAVLRGLRGKNETVVFEFARDCLKAESWPVRLEAAMTLEKLNQPRLIPPLIEALSREDGRLRDDIRDCLRRATGQNFDSDAEQWKRWWIDNKASLEGENPTTALFGTLKGRPAAPEKKSVYGIETRSRKILFIIDTSGSMKEPITQAKGTPTNASAEELENRNMIKIERAKKELRNAIRVLEADATFNIISFGTNVTLWKDKAVKGDMKAKGEALAFVSEMEPAGGTWAYGAFQEAFRLAGMGALDKYYDPSFDTIYFISDGAPTNNDMDKPEAIDPETLLDAVHEWNKLGKLRIHAIAIDPRAGGGKFIQFMKKLASQNEGEYRECAQ